MTVCQPEDRVTRDQKALPLLIARVLWYWPHCVYCPHGQTQQSISRDLWIPNEWWALLFYCQCSLKAHKKVLMLLCCGWCRQACTALCCTWQTCSRSHQVPQSGLAANARMGELAACESRDQTGLNVFVLFFFIQGNLWMKQVLLSDNYMLTHYRMSEQMKNFHILWTLL